MTRAGVQESTILSLTSSVSKNINFQQGMKIALCSTYYNVILLIRFILISCFVKNNISLTPKDPMGGWLSAPQVVAGAERNRFIAGLIKLALNFALIFAVR